MNVAPGTYRNTKSKLLYERPKLDGKWTWRTLGTDDLATAKEILHDRRSDQTKATVGKAIDPYARPILQTVDQVIDRY